MLALVGAAGRAMRILLPRVSRYLSSTVLQLICTIARRLFVGCCPFLLHGASAAFVLLLSLFVPVIGCRLSLVLGAIDAPLYHRS